MTPDEHAAQADERNPLHVAHQYVLRGWSACAAMLIVVAVQLHVWTPSRAWIEHRYANGFYPAWDGVVRSVTQRASFAVGDVFFLSFAAFLLGVWIAVLLRGGKEPVLHTVGKMLLGSGAVMALLFISFLLSWGYNYGRVPIKEKIVLHRERTDAASVRALAERTVQMLNANVAAAHAAHYSDEEMQRRLAPTFFATIRRLGDRSVFPPAPVKPTIFEPFMHASATYGFMDPWTHEINLSSSLLGVERPAAYAHEWSHLSGFADESEANFIAVVSCLASKDPALQYSGWMLVWFNMPSSVHVRTHAVPMVIADVKEIIARYHREVKPSVANAQRVVYDAYLRANAVHAGFDSYHLFVQLLTAGELDASGLPVVKASW
jgi:hypothetical protein